MFRNIIEFFKKANKKELASANSKETAKERLHLVLMQDRANVSVDFLDLMRQEIIEVIKKYIDIDEELMDVRLENKENEDGTQGAPALYANIPIINIKEKARKLSEANRKEQNKEEKVDKDNKDDKEQVVQEHETEEKIEEEKPKQDIVEETGIKEPEVEKQEEVIEETKEEQPENIPEKVSENE